MRSMNKTTLSPTCLALALACGAGCALEEPADLGAERYRSVADAEPERRTGTIATASGPLEIDYEMIDGLAIFQGDMVIPWSDFIDRSVSSAGTVARDQRWPSIQGRPIVPYEIDSAIAHRRPQIEWAMSQLGYHMAAIFPQRTTEWDYVRFVYQPDTNASYLGRRGGMQEIRLSAGAEGGVVLHELSHALGLWHEQSRQDRDSYVNIHGGNIQSGKDGNFQKGAAMDVGTYNYGSLMHYDSYAFSANALPTITKVGGGLIFAQRNGLAETDILGLRALYANPGSGDDLAANELLSPGQSIVSGNGRYRLTYQTDGNLVAYNTLTGVAIWGLPIGGAQSRGACIMQRDGNLVVYNGDNYPIWSSGTAGSDHRLIMQDDGNLVMYRPNGTVAWASNTVQHPLGPAATGFDMQPGEYLSPGQSLSSPGNRFILTYQGDGNLVLYRNFGSGGPVWATNTNGTSPGILIMQHDGNLVLYRGNGGGAIWSTGTTTPGNSLLVQDDGNLVVHKANSVAWSLF